MLGDRDAAITLAAIYQRQEQILSAGGYLRNLTERAKGGKFSTWPMVMALLRARLDGKKGQAEAADGAGASGAEKVEISEALRRSLGRDS